MCSQLIKISLFSKDGKANLWFNLVNLGAGGVGTEYPEKTDHSDLISTNYLTPGIEPGLIGERPGPQFNIDLSDLK